MTAEDLIKEYHGMDINDENESDDCGLSWSSVITLINAGKLASDNRIRELDQLGTIAILENKELLSKIEEVEKEHQKCKDLANVQLKKWTERNEQLQQMNERLVEGIKHYTKDGAGWHDIYTMRYFNALLQSTTQEKGE